ncbi:MAG TPA: HEAT repeat domain-containing protein [Kofleriaceae bacterium]|nr:HEAT repeat domain-containing protein [Kofleriaceae bacterium]
MTRNAHLACLAVAGALVLGLSAPAEAGRGGSFAKIRAAAQHGNPDAIVAELERAERIPCSSECMTFVMGLLEHESHYVRDGAAWWFARRPAQKVEVAERALSLLVTGNTFQVQSAADTLARVGHPRMIPELAAALTREGIGEDGRAAVARAIGELGHRSGNAALTAAMSDPSPLVRRAAVEAWSHILRQQGAAPVAALVADPDLTVRRAAAGVAGRFREASARAALEQLLASDPDPAARRNAAWALGRIGDSASRDVLDRAVDDESPLVRMTARAALRQLR